MDPLGVFRRRVCIDGGLATSLERNGTDLSLGALWSARLLHDDPEAITAVHDEFLRGGADVITTATYQATTSQFRKELTLSTMAAELVIRNGIKLAKKAVATYHRETSNQSIKLVAASVGPYGACLADGSEYRGAYGRTETELYLFHSRRVQVIIDACPDLVAFETIPSLTEAKALCQLMNDKHPHFPFWLSFQCRNAEEIAEGVNIKEAVLSLAKIRAQGCVAIGVNCVDPSTIAPLIEQIRSVLKGEWHPQTIAYPNSGELWQEEWQWPRGKQLSPDSWAEIVDASQADIIGGCCRVYSEHISKLKARISRG